jgi:hypothetical protein
MAAGGGLPGAILLMWGGMRLYDIVLELGPAGLFPGAHPGGNGSSVHLREQPVYRIKKRQELLGVRVCRIVSRRQPEEFLILEGLSRRAVDRVYGKPVDPFWANQVANQLLKLRGVGESAEAPPVSVEIQNIRTLQAGRLPHARRSLPYWQVEVKLKLSNEDQPRYYEAGIVRHARDATSEPRTSQANDTPSRLDTLVVGYAPKDTFQKELVADLMNQLDFSGDG